MARPVKPYLQVSAQIGVLAGRGLILDQSVAAQWLTAVGYYRLSGYWYPWREFVAGQRTRSDDFTVGTTLDNVVALYEFDRKLRTLIHDGVERVEVALRAALADYLGAIDPMAYEDTVNFRPGWDHAGWLRTVRSRVARARRTNSAIRHYNAHYVGIPVWVLVDVLDFADVSMLFEGLPASAQWAVAGRLGVDVDLSALTVNQRTKVLNV